MHRICIDLVGRRFGRVCVVRRDDTIMTGDPRWICVCDCGKEKSIRGFSLRSGRTTSCGCLRRERAMAPATTHGMSYTRVYTIWAKMIARCTNPRHVGYARYGGRGISVCDRWRNSFEAFLADMGDCGSLQIDRIKNNGNYEPNNCRWVTASENNRNRNSNRVIAYNGVSKTLVEWVEQTKLARDTIAVRIDRLGWSIERALTTPVRAMRK